MTVKDSITSVNDSTLNLITGVQQRIVDVNREVASAVAGLVPDVPSWLPTPDTGDTADAADLVAQGFSFQAQLLEANKTFSLGLLEAWREATPKPAGASTSKRSRKSS